MLKEAPLLQINNEIAQKYKTNVFSFRLPRLQKACEFAEFARMSAADIFRLAEMGKDARTCVRFIPQDHGATYTGDDFTFPEKEDDTIKMIKTMLAEFFQTFQTMIIHQTKPIAIESWDWKEQPDFLAISKVVNDFQEKYKNGISILEVETGCDEHAIVIGDKALTEDTAKWAYQNSHEIDEGLDARDLDWGYAKKHIQEIREMHTIIGVNGLPALQTVINPLFVRLEKGERNYDLFDQIISLS